MIKKPITNGGRFKFIFFSLIISSSGCNATREFIASNMAAAPSRSTANASLPQAFVGTTLASFQQAFKTPSAPSFLPATHAVLNMAKNGSTIFSKDDFLKLCDYPLDTLALKEDAPSGTVSDYIKSLSTKFFQPSQNLIFNAQDLAQEKINLAQKIQTVEQRNSLLSLFNSVLQSMSLPYNQRPHFKGGGWLTSKKDKFIGSMSDEATFQKSLSKVEKSLPAGNPTLPPELLDADSIRTPTYTAAQATARLKSYEGYLQNESYFKATLDNLIDLLMKRIAAPNCAFETNTAKHWKDFVRSTDSRLKNQAMVAPLQSIGNILFAQATALNSNMFLPAGYRNRNQAFECVAWVLGRLSQILASKVDKDDIATNETLAQLREKVLKLKQ